jgi:hypothetical protein
MPDRASAWSRFNCTCDAEPNANTRKPSPDKCLVVPSLAAGLRPGCPRNTAANAVTTREGLAAHDRYSLVESP